MKVTWGSKLLADPNKSIGRAIWNTGVYDLAVTEILARLIRPGDTVIDAGANIGYMTLLAARVTGYHGTVYAFEPHPDICEILKENVRIGLGAKVLVRQEALGAFCGTAKLIIPVGEDANYELAYIACGDSDTNDFIEVPMTTIDELFPSQSIDVVKIDVEGHEADVLCGMKNILSSGRLRHIIFENHKDGGGEVARILEGANYSIYSIRWTMDGLELRPLTNRRTVQNYEAPSYLATNDFQDAYERCKDRSWVTLSNISVPN